MSYMKRLGGALFCLALVCVCAATPCAANISVTGSLTQVFRAAPGQALTGQVELVNSGDAVLEARLYLTDYMYHADGTSVFGEPGTGERSCAGWVALHSELVAAPPRSTLAVPFSVRVPAGAAVGSHWCLIMVEQVHQSPPEPASLWDGAAGAGPGQAVARIVARVRYGVQVIIDIGQGAAGVEVLDAGVSRDADGAFVLHLDVKNTGEVRLAPVMKVWAYDSLGQNVGVFEGSRMGLMPGSSARLRAELAGISPGDYAVLVVLETDAGAWGVQYDLALH